jgi:hypothetical protein
LLGRSRAFCPPQRRSPAIGDRLIDELAQHLSHAQRRLAVGGNVAQPGVLFVAQADVHDEARRLPPEPASYLLEQRSDH